MSSSFTYDTLKTVVQHAIADRSATFSADFDVMLRLGEDMCVVDLSLDIWKVSEPFTLTGGQQEQDTPTGMLRLFSVYYETGGDRVFLTPRSLDYLVDYWPSTAEQAPPLYIAHLTETTFYVSPIPDNNYNAVARGIKRPNSLVTDTSGTWLSQNCGRLLYLATLINVEQFDVGDERIEMWKKEYAEELSRKTVELMHLIAPEYRAQLTTVAQ